MFVIMIAHVKPKCKHLFVMARVTSFLLANPYPRAPIKHRVAPPCAKTIVPLASLKQQNAPAKAKPLSFYNKTL